MSDPSGSWRQDVARTVLVVSLVTGLAGMIEGIYFGVVHDPFGAGLFMKGLSVITFVTAYASAGFVAGLLLSPLALLVSRFMRLSVSIAAGMACASAGALYGRALSKTFAAGPMAIGLGALLFGMLGALLVGRVRSRPAGLLIACCVLITTVPLALPDTAAPVAAPSSPGPAMTRTAAQGAAHARNVIVILVDTQRADHLSLYGYPRRTSPSLETLAAGGATFNKAFTAKTKTSPSVASIFTGTWPHTHGIVTCRTTLPEGSTTLAEILNARGFATHSIVANSNVGASFNFDQGFDSVDEIWADPHQSDARGVTDHALGWLEAHISRDGAAPFFLYVHYIDPHAPYAPPPPYSGRFVDDPLYGALAGVKVSQGSDSIGSIRPSVLLPERPTDVDFYVARYDGEIAWFDQQLGRLIEGLRSLGLDHDTLVVFTSDHGEALSEHDVFFSHGEFTYDDTALVPLVMSLPGRVRAGSRVDTVVSLTGLAPTILEAAGVPAAATAEVPSFWALVVNADQVEPQEEPAAFIEGGSVPDTISTSIRAGRWKLIENPQGFDRRPRRFDARAALSMNRKQKGLELKQTGREFLARFELYDLESDPRETINLSGREPQVEEALLARLRAWRAGGAGHTRLQETSRDELPDEVLRNLKSLGYIN